MSVILPGLGASAFAALFLAYYCVLGIGNRGEHDADLATWGVSLVLLDMALLASIVSSATLLRRNAAEPASDAGYQLTLLIVLVAAVAAPLVPSFSFSGLDAGDANRRWPFARVTAINDFFALVAIALVVMLATWLLDGIAGCSVASLAKRLECFRVSLLCTSLLFVAGVLEIRSLFRLRRSFDGAGAPPFDPSVIAGGAGILLTALLVAIYGPLTTTLHRRYEELATIAAASSRDSGTEFTLENWSLANGLGESPLNFLRNQAALLAPFASGAALALFDRFANDG